MCFRSGRGGKLRMVEIPQFMSIRRIRPIRGFTFAELLIALAILGVIATFTIPKVLQSQQDTNWKSMAKEAAATISGAYDQYKLKNGANPSMVGNALTAYMNYVTLYTSGSPMNTEGGSIATCDSNFPCIRFHNGSTLQLWADNFGGTGTTNSIPFVFDADGAPSGAAGMVFWLYYSGNIRTRASILPNTTCSNGTLWNPGGDPAWFSWN